VLGVLLCDPPEPFNATAHLLRALAELEGLITADWNARLLNDERLVLYCARYLHQPIRDIERWPRSKLARRAKLIQELLIDEQKAGVIAGGG
jgi:hypothetical protein